MSKKKNYLAKMLVMLLTMSAFLALSCGVALADNTVKIYVNNAEVECDASPFISANRTYIPMRFAAEPLGAKVDWDEDTKTASFTKGSSVVKVTINSTTAYVNGKKTTLDNPALNRQNRTFVPIRFVSEALDCDCNWVNNAVYITTKENGTGNNNTDFKYLGYYFTYNSLNDLQAYGNELTDISHFAYNLKADGTIEKKSYYQTDKFISDGEAVAKKNGQKIYMLVTGFTKADLTAVLSDETLRTTAINSINDELKTRGIDGVDIDFESVDPSQRTNYVAFIQELRSKIGTNKLINISIMPRSATNQTWLDGYDYGGLAKYADTLSLMCYNEHYSGGAPGAVASYPWVKKVIDYTLGQSVNSKQIILTLGSYGYDWPYGSSGSSLFNSTAKTRAQTYGSTIYRDTISGCPFYVYYDTANVKHTVWFEDETSLSQKASLASDYNLGGIGFWKLGNITDNIWAGVLKATNHPNTAVWQKKVTAGAVYPEQTVQ